MTRVFARVNCTPEEAAEKGTKGVILAVFQAKTDSQVVETSFAETSSLLG
jgi:hypothetical protein